MSGRVTRNSPNHSYRAATASGLVMMSAWFVDAWVVAITVLNAIGGEWRVLWGLERDAAASASIMHCIPCYMLHSIAYLGPCLAPAPWLTWLAPLPDVIVWNGRVFILFNLFGTCMYVLGSSILMRANMIQKRLNNAKSWRLSYLLHRSLYNPTIFRIYNLTREKWRFAFT